MDSNALNLAVASLEGDFELIREIGRGATAIVYLLRDHALERNVAMKVVRSGLGTEEEAVARLQREAQLVAKLHHPNIVKLFGTHRLPDGSVALLMEHVPGRNLKELLVAEGPQPIVTVLEVMKDIASALAYAHRRRIVHRDVKPENIYIDEEVAAARLADFGVARPWDQDSRLTLPGASLGTPAYMSPEQIDGKEADGRSDVYSLGLVGYEMVMGEHPWEGENVFTMIFKQKNELLPLDLPGLDEYPAFRTILKRALQKDPGERWESAASLLHELREVTRRRRASDPLLPVSDPEPRKGSSDEPMDLDFIAMRRSAASPEDPEPDPEPDVSPDTEPEEEVDDWSLSAPTEPAPVVVGRGRNRMGLWAVLVVVLIFGSYGVYRVFSPSDGPLGSPDALQTPPDPFARAQPSSSAGEGDPIESGPLAFLILEGESLSGEVGGEVELEARISDSRGNPVRDTLVNLQVVEGSGLLTAESVRTGEGGRIRVGVRLPTEVGSVLVRATIPGDAGPGAEFLLQALPGPPASAIPIVGERQRADAASVLPELIGVRVVDEFGNPVPGTPVRFQVTAGGGRAGPADTVTDDVGRAFGRWRLGPTSGPQALVVVAPGAADSVATFRATALEAQEEERETPPSAAPAREETPRFVPAQVRDRPFSVGGSNVCHLRGGEAYCRGPLDRGEGIGADLRAIAIGVSHACGLDGEGVAWCWGANESGQLGDGSTVDRSSQVRVSSETSFALLVGGLSHTCGLDGSGGAVCWGRNLNGQLGDRSRLDRGIPSATAGGLSFQELVAGWNHTCGLTGSGVAYCWGLNAEGQIGDGTSVDRLSPTRVPGLFQLLAAGASHTCGIREGEILCWGANRFGQLGTGALGSIRTVPGPVTGLPYPVVGLAAGAVHTCALLEDGAAYCWGQNLHGQLGDGTTENSPTPVPVAGDLRFTTLKAGGANTCGFTAEGVEYCWGFNQGGQLADGTRTNRSTPVRVGES